MPKDQIHVSHLRTWEFCQVLHWKVVIEGKFRPPGIAAHRGTGTDKAVSADYQSMIDTGLLLPVDAIEDAARDGVVHAWDDEGVHLPPDEKGAEDRLKNETINDAITLAVLHHTKIAPKVKPASVQKKWVIHTPLSIDLAGTIDVQEEDKTIRDTKTTGRKYDANAADISPQLTMYAMAEWSVSKVIPPVVFDVLVKTKTKIETQILPSTRNLESFKRLLRRVEIMNRTVERGDAYPTGIGTWICSEKWCGFYPCEYV